MSSDSESSEDPIEVDLQSSSEESDDEGVFVDLFIETELMEIPNNGVTHYVLAVANGYPANETRNKRACIRWMIGNRARRIDYEVALHRNRMEVLEINRERDQHRDRSNRVYRPSRANANANEFTREMRSNQGDEASVKHPIWFRQFIREIIESRATLTEDGITISVPAWSRIEAAFLDQGVEEAFDNLEFGRKQIFMELCRDVHFYLTEAREWNADEIFGAKREKWNILAWMTSIMRMAQSRTGGQGNSCWSLTGKRQDRRPRISTRDANRVKVEVSVPHMMICLNLDAGDPLDDAGNYLEVSHICGNGNCVEPLHLVYENHDDNNLRINCTNYCIQHCGHASLCVHPDADGNVLPCSVHPNGCPILSNFVQLKEMLAAKTI